jgi:hypothetical protein
LAPEKKLGHKRLKEMLSCFLGSFIFHISVNQVAAKWAEVVLEGKTLKI